MNPSVYLRNNLPKSSKDGDRVVNRDEYKSIGTPLIAFYPNVTSVTYFDSFDFLSRFIGNNNIITNIPRMQTYDLIMCKYLCIGLLILCSRKKIEFLTNHKGILDYCFKKRV